MLINIGYDYNFCVALWLSATSFALLFSLDSDASDLDMDQKAVSHPTDVSDFRYGYIPSNRGR